VEISKPILPPKKKLWIEFTKENVAGVPEVEGVYQHTFFYLLQSPVFKPTGNPATLKIA
jgi:hypothetical protein